MTAASIEGGIAHESLGATAADDSGAPEGYQRQEPLSKTKRRRTMDGSQKILSLEEETEGRGLQGKIRKGGVAAPIEAFLHPLDQNQVGIVKRPNAQVQDSGRRAGGLLEAGAFKQRE